MTQVPDTCARCSTRSICYDETGLCITCQTMMSRENKLDRYIAARADEMARRRGETRAAPPLTKEEIISTSDPEFDLEFNKWYSELQG